MSITLMDVDEQENWKVVSIPIVVFLSPDVSRRLRTHQTSFTLRLIQIANTCTIKRKTRCPSQAAYRTCLSQFTILDCLGVCISDAQRRAATAWVPYDKQSHAVG